MAKGDSYYRLKDGENIPVEPVGVLAMQGWLPGTWVKWSADDLTYSGAVGTVDRSDGTGILAGFLMTAPQHTTPVELESDMWTTDARQRAGGETRSDWGSFDASARPMQFDDQGLLQRFGSRIVQMFIPPTGYHRHYVYETDDLAERTLAGSGSTLTYTPGDKLYVSNRGRLTSEMESGAHIWTGYVVARTGEDFEGDYLLAVAAIG